MPKRWTRRQRVSMTLGLVVVLLVVAAVVAVWNRRPPSLYNPDEPVEGITAELARSIPPDFPRVRFTDAAQEAGLSFQHFWQHRSTQLPEDMGSGVAWGDYDNDGDWDLFLVNISGPLTLSPQEVGRSPATCRLYRNNGDGTFTDVTAQAGLALHLCGMAAAWGDFDNDGDLDLVVTSYPDLFLFRNNGDGTFSDVRRQAGLSGFKGFWTGATWGDYDRDGDLDLYVCGYVRYRYDPANLRKVSLQYEAEVPFTLNPSSYPPERNLLLRNEGQGHFVEVAKRAGVDNPTGRSLSAAWCDFDDDGWLDLYVANDVSDNALFRNRGDGTFEDISHEAWVADYRGAMGLGIGDWDLDGDLDIFITHWIAQENALFSNLRIAFQRSQPGKRLTFMDVADQVGLGQIALDYIGWGTSFFDYNNDGRPDLLVVNGSTFQEETDPRRLVPMRHLLFWNKSNTEGFFEVGLVSGDVFQQKHVGRGAAFADYDEDGDVDVVVIHHGEGVALLRNEGGNGNHWLKVRVRGRKDRFGIGAKVRLRVNGQTLFQQIGSQPSYLSQNALEAHFGLGRAEAAQELLVLFPNGRQVRRENVLANQTIVIEE